MDLKSASYYFLCFFSLYQNLVSGVVVDGERRKDMAATRRQTDEKHMIDSFNVKTCGLADPNTAEHEFVNMAREGQFPWIVSFQIKIPNDSTKAENLEVADLSVKATKKETGKKLDDLHFCCGSFISDKWILSAAHCFASDTIAKYLAGGKLKVVSGSPKVSSRDPNNQNLTIKRIYYHSNFDKTMPVGFDIALVELKDKVEFSRKRKTDGFNKQNKPFMNTICLPLRDKKYNFNESARIAGWGLSSSNDETSMPSKLLTTDILINSKDDCVKKYAKALKSDRPKMQRERYDDFICASYKHSRDACQSDSGGPLMQYSGGKAVVIGVVSYGIGCATKGVPGLYTRTSAYINWIKDITKYGKDSSVVFKLLEAKGDELGEGIAIKKIVKHSSSHTETNTVTKTGSRAASLQSTKSPNYEGSNNSSTTTASRSEGLQNSSD